jgi:hypothetical protein
MSIGKASTRVDFEMRHAKLDGATSQQPDHFTDRPDRLSHRAAQ